ncbi:hypothetical protein ACJJIE_03175 [Microbulbifer sp. TRSA001]|uniref:hypothetical protein n=1 Tax=Microbulbifer sp. TRSA001 TaxID=3243381 RepID=UPI00403A58C9
MARKNLPKQSTALIACGCIGAIEHALKPFYDRENSIKINKLTNYLGYFLLKSEITGYNSYNTTATLSARKGNAQPWRFFYAVAVREAWNA